jgi:hypothetical protein
VNIKFSHRYSLTALLLCITTVTAFGRTNVSDSEIEKDTIKTLKIDQKTEPKVNVNSEKAHSIISDSIPASKKIKRDWTTWRPDTKRALWLSIVLPGAGQIYNRKYWKLPIFYGGFLGCIYAMSWNNQMYHDYAQAYVDIMDNDPSTQSYNQFLHLGTKVDASNLQRYQLLFKSRKDRFRRWRDLSVFSFIGVYVLSIIDAYVDASLSDFDISRDLSIHIQPAIIKGNQIYGYSPLNNNAIGVNCYLSF